MFNSLTASLENLLDVAEAATDGELPSKQQLAQLISDGVEIGMIASALGVGEDVLQKILETE